MTILSLRYLALHCPGWLLDDLEDRLYMDSGGEGALEGRRRFYGPFYNVRVASSPFKCGIALEPQPAHTKENYEQKYGRKLSIFPCFFQLFWRYLLKMLFIFLPCVCVCVCAGFGVPGIFLMNGQSQAAPSVSLVQHEPEATEVHVGHDIV